MTNPICRLKRLLSFCPLNVTAPVLRIALHTITSHGITSYKPFTLKNKLWHVQQLQEATRAASHAMRQLGGAWNAGFVTSLSILSGASPLQVMVTSCVTTAFSISDQQPWQLIGYEVRTSTVCRALVQKHVISQHFTGKASR